MRKTIAFYVFFVLLSSGFASEPHVPPKDGFMYTSYNIWKHSSTIYCINFKMGPEIITAGTKVYDVRIVTLGVAQQSSYSTSTAYKVIKFKHADTGEEVTVRFKSKWHPGETIETYKAKMFGQDNFLDLTKGLSDVEIKGIKMGAIFEGMSKRAVLIAYGPPPEHANKNPSAANKWIYWENRKKRKTICFDENDKVLKCGYGL